jgi:P4 family phage/plasmid primase-like protien
MGTHSEPAGQPEQPRHHPHYERLLAAALDYAARGWPVFPCYGKHPATEHGCLDATTDPDTIRNWWQGEYFGCNVAIAMGGLIWALDVDPDDDGDSNLNRLESEHGSLPETVRSITGGGGAHYLFAMNGAAIRNSVGKVAGIADGLDTRGDGGYIIAPPSIHPDTKAPYQWEADLGPEDIEPAEAPPWLEDRAKRPERPERIVREGRQRTPQEGPASPYGQSALDGECQAIQEAANGAQEATLNNAGLKISGLVAGGELDENYAFNALLEAALKMPSHNQRKPWKPRVIENKLMKSMADGSRTPRIAPERRREQTTPPPVEAPPASPNEAASPSAKQSLVRGKAYRNGHANGGQQDGTDDRKPEPGRNASLVEFQANEDAIALEFAARHADTLRYCHDWGMWLRWDGSRWERERQRLAFHFAREIAREANWEGKATPAKASTAAGIERFAQADPRLATVSDQWDVDPWKLGTPGGTVDLCTGELLKARQADHITKRTAVAPAAPLHDDDCPLWTRFLDEATRGDKDLQRFLQQMAGYCLTGDIREHALFFVYGPGGNGKGVFLNTIMKVLGDYATTAAMDTFTASHGDKHTTDLAKLRGARMVTASETEEGRAWAESRIKQLTGGDRISARFMRQDNFEFWPTFKLLIVGNHKPILRNVDEAAKRRFNIIPFIHKPQQRNLQLEEELKAEWPAILRWMIDGCLDWQQNGLVRPISVGKATDEYFKSQDLFGQWLEECCELHPGNDLRTETAADLFASWKAFLESHGENPGTSKSLGDKLSQREVGLVRRRHPMSGKPCVMRTGISIIRQSHSRCDDV